MGTSSWSRLLTRSCGENPPRSLSGQGRAAIAKGRNQNLVATGRSSALVRTAADPRSISRSACLPRQVGVPPPSALEVIMECCDSSTNTHTHTHAALNLGPECIAGPVATGPLVYNGTLVVLAMIISSPRSVSQDNCTLVPRVSLEGRHWPGREMEAAIPT